MNWIDFFDRIFVVNLPRRSDRLSEVKWEMMRYRVPFLVWEATEHSDGRSGISSTLRDLFSYCVGENYKNVLIFEDDPKFLRDPELTMDKVIKQIPIDYDMLYLGVNLTRKYVPQFHSENLIKVKRGLALHACAYSRKGMQKILDLDGTLPIDLNIADHIHPQGDSYATFPMLVTQRPGISDIEKQHKDWSYALEDRFYERMSLNPAFKHHLPFP